MRLLLLEFLLDAPRRNDRSALFPFLKGLAKALGGESLWLCFGSALSWRAPGDGALPAGGPLVAALPDADRRALRIYVEAFEPTHVLASEALDEASRAALESAAPGIPLRVATVDDRPPVCVAAAQGEPTRPAYLADWAARFLGADATGLGEPFLADAVVPDYAALPCNEAAWRTSASLALVGGTECGWGRPVEANPRYQGVDLRAVPHPNGCAFCTRARIVASLPGRDPLALAEKQLRALVATAGDKGRFRGVLDVSDRALLLQLDGFAARVLAASLPPTTLRFSPCADDLLAAREAVGRALPLLAQGGHRLRLQGIGVESFSAAENERLHKGVSVAQVDALLASLRRWREEFPAVLGGAEADEPSLSTIVFTPWTTLADVRASYEGGKARGLPAAGEWLCSSLRMRASTPIAALARHEKDLVVERFPDRALHYLAAAGQEDAADLLNWQFRDSKAADLFAVMARLVAAAREGAQCPWFAGDPDFAQVAAQHARAREAGLSPLALGLAMLDRLEQGPQPASREALLREAVDALAAAPRAPDAVAPKAAPAAPEPEAPRAAQAPAPERAETAQLRRLFHEWHERRPEALRDVQPASVRQVDLTNHHSIQLEVLLSGRRMVLELFDRDPAQPCFFRTARFNVVHSPETPVRGSAERDLLQKLMALAEGKLSPA